MVAWIAAGVLVVSPWSTISAFAIDPSTPSDSTSGATTDAPGKKKDSDKLDTVVVTGSGVGEDISTIPQTVRYYDQQDLNDKWAKNLNDFLSKSVGVWTSPGSSPAHANGVILRGATNSNWTQAWDNASEVTVLVNGRPTGTANIAKFTTYDVDHIEILKGPASVIYGSTAMGGVINLITKDGVNDPGGKFTGSYASFDHYTGTLEWGEKKGKVDWYAQISDQNSGNYDSGGSADKEQRNTGYDTRSANVTLGYDLNDLNHLQFTLRSDGMYNAGHPGVTQSGDDYDNRYNQSVELIYTGATQEGDVSWKSHPYFVQDVDNNVWHLEPTVQVTGVGASLVPANAPGILSDDNTRRNNKIGHELTVEYHPIESNKIVSGVSLAYDWVENTRSRTADPAAVGTGTVGSVNYLRMPPWDLNSETYNAGVYLEDAQKFFGDKIEARSGVRYDWSDAKLLATANDNADINTATGQIPPNSKAKLSNAVTWRTGATYAATDWLTLRSSIGTGFLAVAPDQLYGTVIQTNGVTNRGNANLKDEWSQGWEFGGHVDKGPLSADFAYFVNDIHNRISSVTTPGTVVNQRDNTWVNLHNVIFSGLEWETSYDLAKLAKWDHATLVPYASGTYYLQHTIHDGAPNLTSSNPNQITGLPEFQATLGLRNSVGKWSSDFYALLTGQSYQALTNTSWATGSQIWTRATYYTLNLREAYQVTKNVQLFFGINNLLDLNYSSTSPVLNDNYSTNIQSAVEPGASGSSAPGREFYGGFSYAF